MKAVKGKCKIRQLVYRKIFMDEHSPTGYFSSDGHIRNLELII